MVRIRFRKDDLPNDIVTDSGHLFIREVKYQRSGVVCRTAMVFLVDNETNTTVPIMESPSFQVLKTNMYRLAAKPGKIIRRQVNLYNQGKNPLKILKVY